MRLSPEARERAKLEAQRAIDEAADALTRGVISDEVWCERVSSALAASYLADEDDPRWQSGYDGDPLAWREARELVLDGVHRDGTFLDVGCANGYLMECLHQWAREHGRSLVMHGLEINPDLANTARRRLPAWADRIHQGNVMIWTPRDRFTYVRTGLEYVPPSHRAALVARLLRDIVEPEGRLIVGPVKAPDLPEVLAAFGEAGVEAPGVCASTDRRGVTRYIVYSERR